MSEPECLFTSSNTALMQCHSSLYGIGFDDVWKRGKIWLRDHNWQKWKRVFLTCPCHRDEVVGLKNCKYFVKIWYFVNNYLRVRAFFHKTVRVCHVYCNFKIGFTCWITVIFGTLKDGRRLLINTLVSNICFTYRNMFQNGVDALSKIVDAFLSKSSKFHLVWIIR